MSPDHDPDDWYYPDDDDEFGFGFHEEEIPDDEEE